MNDILVKLRDCGTIVPKDIDAILRAHNKQAGTSTRAYAKKMIMPFFLETKNSNPKLWSAWSISPEEEKALFEALRLKPRRTASGVATITVITKPWPCSSNCLYCPNDLRMPKSYLHDEPACQRAERNYFDPYLQVTVRLRTLMQMGHVTDKVELIVLGGTWSDYPEPYQIWFISRLFAALNDAGMPSTSTNGAAAAPASPHDTDAPPASPHNANMPSASFSNAAGKEEQRVRELYESAGFTHEDKKLSCEVSELQGRVNEGALTFNQAFSELYGKSDRWGKAQTWQTASWEQLEKLHTANETAAHRCVGMVIETRPDNITVQNLTAIRRLGCTKVQIGIQSTDTALLAKNHRLINEVQLQRAFELLRLFGFKSHTHFMTNLYGSNPDTDIADYQRFVSDPIFCPDEIKLYPCVLLEGTGLEQLHRQGAWQPYEEPVLRNVLAQCVAATPPYTRISRMIRDFSAPDIIAGNRKTNLRQLVEQDLEDQGLATEEIRRREVGNGNIDAAALRLLEVPYETSATHEVFLQWVTPDNRIAGFLRLSLPKAEALQRYTGLPVQEGEAMIREVHVYGKVAALNHNGESAQHLGLGKKLIAHACKLAREAGFERINVISAIGTREYYRARGFTDNGLYQQKEL